MSATATWIMCIVIVGSLVGMLSVITLAARHPAFKSPRVPSVQGPVLGGTHIAEGGRSVAPDRDAPAEFTDTELQTIQVAETGRPEGPRPEVPAQQMPSAPAPVPEQAVSEQAVPEQAVPEQTRPDLAVPEQAVPAQRSGEAGQPAPQQTSSQSDQAGQALPRQRSGQADRSERTTR